MKKLILILSSFVVLSSGLSSAFAEIMLSRSTSKSLPNDEFTGVLVRITYCNKNGEATCYQDSNEQLVRANIKSDSGSNIIIDFKDKDLSFGERLIPLVGKKIHAKFSPSPNSNHFSYDVQYIDISE